MVNWAHAGNADAKVIAGADRGFVQFTSMEENINTLINGSYRSFMRQHYHSGIAETSINWMKTCMQK